MVGADSIREASQSILFWGTKLSPNEPYKKVLPFLLTIQSASILPSAEGTPITLNAIINTHQSFPLCTLRPKDSYQTSLGLILNPGTTIDFRVEGKGDLYLSGYFHIEADEDELIEEEDDEKDAKLEALRELYSQAEELGLEDEEGDDDDDDDEEMEESSPQKKGKPKAQEKPKAHEKTKEKPKTTQEKNQDKNKKSDQNKQNPGKNQQNNQNKTTQGKNQENQQKGKKKKRRFFSRYIPNSKSHEQKAKKQRLS